MTKEHILSEIKRTAVENGGIPLGQYKFEKETGIKPSHWYGIYWTKWGDALTEVGYPPNKWQSAYSDDSLIQNLVKLILELGKFPTRGELKLKAHQDKDFPSLSPFYRMGNKQKRIQTVLNYCESHIFEGKERVISICKMTSAKYVPSQLQDASDERDEFGFVYLMKSGKHYKIGLSKCAEMREFQLRILLPEKLELIHKIKTDDMFGIEQYWHNRFKDKRKGGEWFELSVSDVKAFRRRKFM